MSDALRQALRRQAPDLSRQVLDRMYENPFWMERYGERGRRFADEDGLHHVSYLDQALAAGDPAVFEKYARWLRAVLVSRGMCSAHLAEHFVLLADAIDRAGVPDADLARAILTRGAESLVYREGPAAALEGQRSRLLDAVRAAADGVRADDLDYLVSYRIDAAATGAPGHYTAFAARLPPAVVDALTTAERSLDLPRPASPSTS